MAAGHPAQARTRRAVRLALQADPPGTASGVVLAAVSGGADSLALAAALAAEAPGLGVAAGAVIVDHRLQADSASVAATAEQACRALALEPVLVTPVTVACGPSGIEASARTARYAALEQIADQLGAGAVLLGHTRDDQAEQVLLGLLRGSGARSLAGMPAQRGIFRRPFLDLPRSDTTSACQAWGLAAWNDPMNTDRAFSRVRARAALADLERDLGPGVGASLVRTAQLLRVDADYLEEQATAALDELLTAAICEQADGLTVESRLPVAAWRWHPAVRTRVWRQLLVHLGSPAGSLTRAHVTSCDALLTQWRGQGLLDLPGVQVRRQSKWIVVTRLHPSSYVPG